MNISEGIILALSAFTWFLTFGLKYWWALLIIYLVYKAAQFFLPKEEDLDSLSENKEIKSEGKEHGNN